MLLLLLLETWDDRYVSTRQDKTMICKWEGCFLVRVGAAI